MADETKTHAGDEASSVELTLDGPWDNMTDAEIQRVIGLEDEDVEPVIFEDEEMERYRLERADDAVRKFLSALDRMSRRMTNERYARLFFERLTVRGAPILCSALSNVFDFSHSRGGRNVSLCRTTFARFWNGVHELAERSRADPLLTPYIDVIESTLTSLEVRTGTSFLQESRFSNGEIEL